MTKDGALWDFVKSSITPLGQYTSRRVIHNFTIGRLQTNSKLDLHGLSIKEAHNQTLLFLGNTRHKFVTIITGRSGSIRREFPYWLMLNPKVLSFELVSKGGAFRVKLKINFEDYE